MKLSSKRLVFKEEQEDEIDQEIRNKHLSNDGQQDISGSIHKSKDKADDRVSFGEQFGSFRIRKVSQPKSSTKITDIQNGLISQKR